MRISHVIPTLNPAAGGPPMVALRLAAAQADLGHDVTIVCYGFPGDQSAFEKSLTPIPHMGRVKIHPLQPGGRLETILGYGLKKKLAPLLDGQDFIQIHGVWEPILRVAAGLAFSRGTPYAVMPHGMLDRWSMSQKRIKKRLAMALAYRRMLERAAYLHALNKDEVGPIKELGITTSSQIIPNGVFMEEIEPMPTAGAFRARHPELGDDPFVLFLSRLHFKKGLDYLADTFKAVADSHPRARLVVAGPDGGVRQTFEQSVHSAGVSDRVHVVGPIYGAAKYEAIVDATCFCLPSRQEGFSIAITEALACGTPVVISEACHFPEVAQAQAGFVLPLDSNRFAQEIRKLLDDSALRTTMSGNARSLVSQRYTWPKIAEQTLAYYQQVI